MKIVLHSLILRCKKQVIEVPFSESITYFYGKMGAGKSTILQLIDFCLGNELIETPAIQQEFIGTQLQLQIGDNLVSLERNKGSNQVIVEWTDLNGNDPISITAPIKTTGKPIIYGTEIEILSDVIFYLAGMHPPKVRKSKHKEDTELIRLSFRDLMWYCYLDQDHIDSSFFHLEREANEFKKIKSRDVMRLILGYHQEEVAQLESDLLSIRRKRLSLKESSESLHEFLLEHNIDSPDKINLEIASLKESLNDVYNKKETIKSTLRSSTPHHVEELRNKARYLFNSLVELEEAQSSLLEQIERRKKLLGEFTSASMKISRSFAAREVLKDVDFICCPKCHHDLQIRSVTLPNDQCSLCSQPLNDHEETITQDIEVVKKDLRARQQEISASLETLAHQQFFVQREIQEKRQEKMVIDIELSNAEKEYDSAYLSQAKTYEQQTGTLQAKIDSFEKLLPLSQKVVQLRSEASSLASDEEKVKNNLDAARKFAEKDASNLKELKELFIENLINVGLPGIEVSNLVKMNTHDFIPYITKSEDDNVSETEFANLGSGGKKTIYKCCFALAIHRLAAKRHVPLPTFLLIDTPMKNISERENHEIFSGFYTFLYKLFTTELSETQLIIVDKEFYPPSNELKIDLIDRHMTPDDSKYPPLITYYRGH